MPHTTTGNVFQFTSTSTTDGFLWRGTKTITAVETSGSSPPGFAGAIIQMQVSPNKTDWVDWNVQGNVDAVPTQTPGRITRPVVERHTFDSMFVRFRATAAQNSGVDIAFDVTIHIT